MMDIIERLRESVVVDAFAQRTLLDGVLAERLIRERHEAADEIERLRAIVAHRNGMLGELEYFWMGSKEELWGNFEAIDQQQGGAK